MAEPKIELTMITDEPSLKDVLDVWKRDTSISMNCHHLAVIESFDSTNQTATAKISYKKTYFDVDSNTRKYIPRYVDYPILLDCPVIVITGGTSALTMPIQKGDDCLVLFNDRDIDSWFKNGQVAPVPSTRLHSFSDGLILVGVRPLSRVLGGYDASRAVLRTGDSKVAVGAKIEISNSSQNLKSLLVALIDEIKLLTVTCAAPGNPSSAPINAAAIGAIATDIEALLE